MSTCLNPVRGGFGPSSDAPARVLNDLDLLQAVFSFVPATDLLLNVPLVNRAFAAACGSPGPCWRQLEVDGLRLPPLEPCSAAARLFWSRLAAWIARRAGDLRTLRLHNLRMLLAPLEQAGQGAALSGVWAALAPRCALRRLELGHSTVALAPGAVASLACLASLQHLHVHTAGCLDFAEVESLAGGLPQLEELSVRLLRRRGRRCAFAGAFPAGLTRLKHLRALHLEAPYSAPDGGACQLPDSVGKWASQMERLHLINLGLQRLPASLASLGRLRELCLGRNRLGHLPGALPPEMTRLTALARLELQYNGFETGPPPLVGQLASLEELNLGGNLWGSGFADLPPSYRQLRRLKWLTLTNCELRELPPVVAGLSCLRLLKLNINRLETLPGGPYLATLECLDLSHNRFTAGCPAALADAPRLQTIALQFRGVHYSDPAAALRDAAAQREEPPERPPRAARAAVTVVALPAGGAGA